MYLKSGYKNIKQFFLSEIKEKIFIRELGSLKIEIYFS